MKVNLEQIKARGCGRTAIEWADFTANPVRARVIGTDEVGWACRKVSAGCANCYAETINGRFGTKRDYTAAGMADVEWVLDEGVLQKMLTFKPRGPFKAGSKPIVFLGDMNDLFYGDEADEKACASAVVPFRPIPFEWLDRIMAVCALRPDVFWLFLTKRPGRMAGYFADDGGMSLRLGTAARELVGRTKFVPYVGGRVEEAVDFFDEHDGILPNVGLGASAENQAALDERVPHLLRCPGVRFLSLEPLLGEIDLSAYLGGEYVALPGDRVVPNYNFGIDWIIAGGESGAKARPCDVGWLRSIKDRCADAGVPCFIKQAGANAGWTERAPTVTHRDGTRGTPAAPFRRDPGFQRLPFKDRAGGDPAEWPADLRVRAWPEVMR